MPPITNDWADYLREEYKKPYYRKLYQTVMDEYHTKLIFPPADDIFNAFHFTPVKDVKVVILGQDPYHGDGQAHGLSFSVKPGVEAPPSLVNIYKELNEDLGCYIPNNWGRPAQSKKVLLNNPNHLILEAPHPSPLSAYRGFFGCHHFSKANEFLTQHGLEPIDWQIENI